MTHNIHTASSLLISLVVPLLFLQKEGFAIISTLNKIPPQLKTQKETKKTLTLTNCTYTFPQLVHFHYKMKYMLIISETVQPTSQIQQNS